MKKHLIGMIALSSSLFMGAYTLNDKNAIQAQTNGKNMIKVEVAEYKNETTSMNQLLNSLFEENLSFDTRKEIETEHFGFKAYQVGHLTVETDIRFNQMEEQVGTVILYDNGCSSISNDFQLTLNSNEPIKEFVKNTKYSFQVSFSQNDVTAPVIKLKKDAIKLDYKASFKPKNYIKSAVDNIDGKVDVKIDNPVNTKKPGNYKVTYTATDKNGNKTSKTLKVTVKKKPVYTAPKTGANTSGNIYDMFRLINETRKSYGLKPYKLDTGALGAATQLRAVESINYLGRVPYHIRPNGTSYHSALHEMGISSANAVEILTYASSSPRGGLNWWLNSPVHRSFVLSSNHTRIGIGYSNGMWCAIVQ